MGECKRVLGVDERHVATEFGNASIQSRTLNQWITASGRNHIMAVSDTRPLHIVRPLKSEQYWGGHGEP